MYRFPATTAALWEYRMPVAFNRKQNGLGKHAQHIDGPHPLASVSKDVFNCCEQAGRLADDAYVSILTVPTSSRFFHYETEFVLKMRQTVARTVYDNANQSF